MTCIPVTRSIPPPSLSLLSTTHVLDSKRQHKDSIDKCHCCYSISTHIQAKTRLRLLLFFISFSRLTPCSLGAETVLRTFG